MSGLLLGMMIMLNKINNGLPGAGWLNRNNKPHYERDFGTYNFRKRYEDDMYTNDIGKCNNHVCANCGEHL
jgi:hypothetical protein